MKPVGNLKIVAVEDTKPGHKLAFYYKITLEDEEGNRFYIECSTFLFDLQPADKENVLTMKDIPPGKQFILKRNGQRYIKLTVDPHAYSMYGETEYISLDDEVIPC